MKEKYMPKYEKGLQLTGKIKRIKEFGIFVEIEPGKDGLVHISLIPRERQRSMHEFYPPNTDALVEVLDYNPENGRVRLKFV